MKKNLFLLFSVYFFVIQPLVIWALWGQANFFRLGGINFLAIILIGIVYNTLQGGVEKMPEHEKHPVQEAKTPAHEHVHAAVKSHKKRWELAFPALLSLIVAAIIFFMFQYKSATIEVMFLLAIIIGFIVFVIVTLIFKHRITKWFWSLLWTKLYIILLIIGLAWTAYGYYKVHTEFNASLTDYLAQNLLGEERIPTDIYVYTGEWTVLGSWLWNTTLPGDVSTDVIVQETGTVITNNEQLTTNNEQLTGNNDSIATTPGNQKLIDAVSYLLKKYTIPLVTTKNVRFTYVSSTSPYYPEWRTAYANKLIGTSTNPTKYIICDSYIVMKWLLEKRDVTYTSSTVLNKFRAEAVKRDALNGCEKGKVVTDATL